jgi:hypothetical protein
MHNQFVPRVAIRTDRRAEARRRAFMVLVVAVCITGVSFGCLYGAIQWVKRQVHSGVIELFPVCEFCGQLMTGGEHRCSGGK